MSDDTSVGCWWWFWWVCWEFVVLISILPDTEGVQMDVISLLICSTVLVNRVHSACISFLSASSSVAYSVFMVVLGAFEVLGLVSLKIFVIVLLPYNRMVTKAIGKAGGLSHKMLLLCRK